VATTKAIRKIAKQASKGQIFHAAVWFGAGVCLDRGQSSGHRGLSVWRKLRLRVGALPQFQTNEMKYNLTWSTDGLINEYGNPCEAIMRKDARGASIGGLSIFLSDGGLRGVQHVGRSWHVVAKRLRGESTHAEYKTTAIEAIAI